MSDQFLKVSIFICNEILQLLKEFRTILRGWLSKDAISKKVILSQCQVHNTVAKD